MLPDSSALFWRNHFYYPFAVFVAIALIIEFGNVDMRLADAIYAFEGGSWAFKNIWLTSVLIHKMGRFLSLLLAVIVLILLAQSFFTQKLQQYRRELIYLLVAAGGGSLLISVLKDLTHVSCAWDFARYGGKAEYATVFTEMLHLSGGDCFPAGHASGGYAWVALYFIGVHLHSRLRWLGLGFALGVGLLFGISQQFRGAHFISHDWWTLGICWFFSLLCYRLMLRKHSKPL